MMMMMMVVVAVVVVMMCGIDQNPRSRQEDCQQDY
jgi:uncharacterized membrane protein